MTTRSVGDLDKDSDNVIGREFEFYEFKLSKDDIVITSSDGLDKTLLTN